MGHSKRKQKAIWPYAGSPVANDPPEILVRQVARALMPEVSPHQMTFPPQIVRRAIRKMQKVHYHGLENRGAEWVSITLKKIAADFEYKTRRKARRNGGVKNGAL